MSLTAYGQVVATARMTPTMVRVILGGDGLEGFEPGPFTDAYINVALLPDGAPYQAPFDLDRVRAQVQARWQPVRRRYTVRRWDPTERLLMIDVVVHGETGVGGPWAARARPGDALAFTGPSGSYRPDPTADWHLLAGDESALPAIAASLEAISPAGRAVVRVVVDGPDFEIDLPSPRLVDLVWLHRTGNADHDEAILPRAISDLNVPPGRVHAFVHGEAGEVRQVRRLLLAEWGVARADLSCSPYWRRHLTDEAWRRIKPAWAAEVERDVARKESA